MKGIGSPGRGPPVQIHAQKYYERSDCCEKRYGHFRYLPPDQAGV